MLVAGTIAVSCVVGLFLTRPSLRHFDSGKLSGQDSRDIMGDLQEQGVGQTSS
jgi:hypothetical protein